MECFYRVVIVRKGVFITIVGCCFFVLTDSGIFNELGCFAKSFVLTVGSFFFEDGVWIWVFGEGVRVEITDYLQWKWVFVAEFKGELYEDWKTEICFFFFSGLLAGSYFFLVLL